MESSPFGECRELAPRTVPKHWATSVYRYDGGVFRSLPAIATEVAGTRWNGYASFGLGDLKEASGA